MDLQRAIEIVQGEFANDLDKGGMPYVGHLARVAANLDGDREIVAWLHDLLEDKPDWNAERLKQEGFSDEVVEAVVAITKVRKDRYKKYLKRVKENPLARDVKLMDLKDNMDLSRIPNPNEKDFMRVEKYQKAYQFLID